MRIVVLLLNLLFAMNVFGAPFIYVHPLPGSAEHNPETTLIVRLTEAEAEIQNLRWSVVGSRSGEHLGRTITSANTFIFQPDNSKVIRIELPYAERVKVTVSDLRGREVLTLLNGKMTAGQHNVTFDAQDFAGGVYFYRLEAGAFVDVRKMILIK